MAKRTLAVFASRRRYRPDVGRLRPRGQNTGHAAVAHLGGDIPIGQHDDSVAVGKRLQPRTTSL